MSVMLLWNVINLFDGEARWFLTFLFFLALASAITHVWRWLCLRLHNKFLADDSYIKDAAIQASLLPVTWYVWFLFAIQSLDLVLDRFFSDSLSEGLKILYGASAVLTVGWFLLRFKHNLTGILLRKSHNKEVALEPGKVYVMAKLVSVIITVLVILLLMEVTGVNINTLIAFGGISGLAIAFASQEMIANFFGGVMIHINQPFAIDDYINLPSSSIGGHVEEIGWYETILRSKEKTPIYIPNSLFSKAYVINATRRTHRRISEIIAIRHQDFAKAIDIVNAIRQYLANSEHVDSKEGLLVHISQVGAYSVEMSISCLSTILNEKSFLQFRDKVLVQAALIIADHGAEIAIPLEAVLPLEKK